MRTLQPKNPSPEMMDFSVTRNVRSVPQKSGLECGFGAIGVRYEASAFFGILRFLMAAVPAYVRKCTLTTGLHSCVFCCLIIVYFPI